MLISKKTNINASFDDICKELSNMLNAMYGHAYFENKDNQCVFFPAHHWRMENKEYRLLSVIVENGKITLKETAGSSQWGYPPYSLMFDKISAMIDQLQEYFE